MKNKLDRVSIRPGVSLLTVLPHLNYKPWFALAEFLDNSVQSYLTNRAALRRLEGKRFVLSIDIDIDVDRGVIVVRDNAAGIDRSAYARAFRPAEMPADASGLSEFGMGMKSAAAWLAPRWTVRTSALGETVERTVSFDIASIVADTVEELEVRTKRADRDAHFTEIVLTDIRKAPKSRTLAKIRDHLASLYRRFLAKGEVLITLNGEPLAFEQPEVLVAPRWFDPTEKPRRWKVPVDIKLDGGRRVEGWAALRARGSTTRAGFALLRRDRVIEGSADETYRPRELFGASNSFTYQRLFGELSLVGFAVSHTKDGIRWDEAEDDLIFQLKALLSREDMPLLDQAQNWRAGDLAASVAQPSSDCEVPRPGPRRAVSASNLARISPIKSGGRPGSEWRRLSLDVGGRAWEVQLTFDADGDGNEDWLQVHSLADEADGVRRLLAKLSMHHPFSSSFLQNDEKGSEGVARLVIGLAIAEAIAQDDGVRSSGRVRASLNELLMLGLAEP